MEPAVYPGFHTRKCQDATSTCCTCGSADMHNATDASSSHRTFVSDVPRAMRSQPHGRIAPARVPENVNGRGLVTTNEIGRLLELEKVGLARPPECPCPTWTSR